MVGAAIAIVDATVVAPGRPEAAIQAMSARVTTPRKLGS
jgi:hypothetical protein